MSRPTASPCTQAQAVLDRRGDDHEGGIDWAMGELIAFGSLLMEGTPIRLAGQDSRRGTFVQRHAVLIDKSTAAEWTPLLYLGERQARFWVHDSLLSEFAAMGFEYGYSVERPDALVLWEAQFGDFANGAQTIIDEFISSSEQKWGQRSSVTLLLPHGYEGQGPDHSSARIERYLQLCAEDNMTLATRRRPRRTSTCCAARRMRVHAGRSSSSPRSRCCASRRPRAPSRTSPTAGSARCCPTRRGSTGRRHAGAARLGQGRLRPRGRADQAGGHADRDRAGRAARSGAGCEIAEELALYPEADVLGSRTSHATRARGRSWPSTSPRRWRSTARPGRSGSCRGWRPPPLPPAHTRSTMSSRRTSSPPPSTADRLVLHGPRDRGARRPARRGGGLVRLARRAATDFVDLNPEFETPVERLATWLARLDDDD